MPSGGDLKSKWFFTDSRSRERDMRVEMRIRIRAVSGRPVATDGVPVVSEPDPESGDQLLSIVGLAELMSCIHAWGCPVTISPPEGALPWQLELEDGVHEGRAA